MATSEQNKFTLGTPPSILIDYDLGKVIHNCKKPTDSKTLYESISEIALNVDTPATTSSSRSVCPSTSSPASMSTAALNVDTPETT
mgnify:CR=1 FL=1